MVVVDFRFQARKRTTKTFVLSSYALYMTPSRLILLLMFLLLSEQLQNIICLQLCQSPLVIHHFAPTTLGS